MGAFLMWTTEGGPVQTLTFDVVTAETHDLAVQVTEHAVERGADVADHARPQLDQVSLTVFVSNTPLDASQFSGSTSSAAQDLDVPAAAAPLLTPPTTLTVKTWNNPLPLVGFEGVTILQPDVGLKPTPARQWRAQVLTFNADFDAVADTLAMLYELRRTAQIITVVTNQRDYDSMVIESVTLSRDPGTGTGGSFTIGFRQLRVVESKVVAAPKPTEARGNKAVSKGNVGTKDTGPKQSLLKRLLGGL